jgi:hypothetical protein
VAVPLPSALAPKMTILLPPLVLATMAAVAMWVPVRVIGSEVEEREREREKERERRKKGAKGVGRNMFSFTKVRERTKSRNLQVLY